MKFPKSCSILLLSFTLISCATVIRGTTDDLRIESSPSGAVARLSNGRVCVTPCVLKISRKESLNISFEKEGYEPASAKVTSGVSGAGGTGVAGNVLLGGLIGIGVDSYSGAAKNLTPNPVIIYLNKITPEDNG